MVNPLAPMEEKLSMNFCCMAVSAVLMPTSAMMPKAMIETVKPVRSRLALTVRKDIINVSRKFMIKVMKKGRNGNRQ